MIYWRRFPKNHWLEWRLCDLLPETTYIRVVKTVVLGSGGFVSYRNKGFDRNGENDEFAFYTTKSGFLVLRTPKTTKMAKVALRQNHGMVNRKRGFHNPEYKKDPKDVRGMFGLLPLFWRENCNFYWVCQEFSGICHHRQMRWLSSPSHSHPRLPKFTKFDPCISFPENEKGTGHNPPHLVNPLFLLKCIELNRFSKFGGAVGVWIWWSSQGDPRHPRNKSWCVLHFLSDCGMGLANALQTNRSAMKIQPIVPYSLQICNQPESPERICQCSRDCKGPGTHGHMLRHQGSRLLLTSWRGHHPCKD